MIELIDFKIVNFTSTTVKLKWKWKPMINFILFPSSPSGYVENMSAYQIAVIYRKEEDDLNYKIIDKVPYYAQHYKTKPYFTYTDTHDITPNTTYQYYIELHSQNNVSKSNVAEVQTYPQNGLVPPQNLHATGIRSYKVVLRWNFANPNAFYGIHNEIWRSSDNSTYTLQGMTAMNTNLYPDTDLKGNTYYYKVRVSNAKSSSPFSNTIEVSIPANLITPPTPANLHVINEYKFKSAKYNLKIIQIKWDYKYLNVDYGIYVSTEGHSGDFSIYKYLWFHPNTTYKRTSYILYLDLGKVYYFKIKALYNGVSSNFSNTIEV